MGNQKERLIRLSRRSFSKGFQHNKKIMKRWKPFLEIVRLGYYLAYSSPAPVVVLIFNP